MIALLYTGLDEKDAAIDWLNKALQERDPQIIFVGLDPEFESLRTETRFLDLLHQMNVPLL